MQLFHGANDRQRDSNGGEEEKSNKLHLRQKRLIRPYWTYAL